MRIGLLLEAQACGRPVLAGRSGGTAETMRIPETGVTVNCDGPDELAAAVQELLGNSDLLNRMGEAGRCWVVDHFDWESLSRRAAVLFSLTGREQPVPVVGRGTESD